MTHTVDVGTFWVDENICVSVVGTVTWPRPSSPHCTPPRAHFPACKLYLNKPECILKIKEKLIEPVGYIYGQ